MAARIARKKAAPKPEPVEVVENEPKVQPPSLGRRLLPAIFFMVILVGMVWAFYDPEHQNTPRTPKTEQKSSPTKPLSSAPKEQARGQSKESAPTKEERLAAQFKTRYEYSKAAFMAQQAVAAKDVDDIDRDDLLAISQDFHALYIEAKQWPNRPAALYRAAEVMEFSAKSMEEHNDYIIAVDLYEKLAQEFPQSILADDALYAAAHIWAFALDDSPKALQLLTWLRTKYPKGDKFSVAAALEEKLLPPPAPVKPVEPTKPASPKKPKSSPAMEVAQMEKNEPSEEVEKSQEKNEKKQESSWTTSVANMGKKLFPFLRSEETAEKAVETSSAESASSTPSQSSLEPKPSLEAKAKPVEKPTKKDIQAQGHMKVQSEPKAAHIKEQNETRAVPELVYKPVLMPASLFMSQAVHMLSDLQKAPPAPTASPAPIVPIAPTPPTLEPSPKAETVAQNLPTPAKDLPRKLTVAPLPEKLHIPSHIRAEEFAVKSPTKLTASATEKKPDNAGVNLSGENLSSANLSGANKSHAELARKEQKASPVTHTEPSLWQRMSQSILALWADEAPKATTVPPAILPAIASPPLELAVNSKDHVQKGLDTVVGVNTGTAVSVNTGTDSSKETAKNVDIKATTKPLIASSAATTATAATAQNAPKIQDDKAVASQKKSPQATPTASMTPALAIAPVKAEKQAVPTKPLPSVATIKKASPSTAPGKADKALLSASKAASKTPTKPTNTVAVSPAEPTQKNKAKQLAPVAKAQGQKTAEASKPIVSESSKAKLVSPPKPAPLVVPLVASKISPKVQEKALPLSKEKNSQKATMSTASSEKASKKTSEKTEKRQDANNKASAQKSVATPKAQEKTQTKAPAKPVQTPQKEDPIALAETLTEKELNSRMKHAPAKNLAAQLGLSIRTVYVDIGHGGKDQGTAHNGLIESEVVLDIGQKVGNLLKAQGFNVVYSRTKNIFIPLSMRPESANEMGADLFVSIHMNAFTQASIHGFETYYLDFTRNSEASRVATLENSVSDRSLGDLQNVLAKMLLNVRTKESRGLAQAIQRNTISTLHSKGFKTRDGGTRAAPFHVLIGTSMPAVLVEVGYCTNKNEAKLLKRADYRQLLARGIVQGIVAYKKQLEKQSAAHFALTQSADSGK